MDSYKIKIVIFVLLVISLFITFFYGVFGFSLSYLTEEEIKEVRERKNDLISYFTINNTDTIYDNKNNVYFYSVPGEYKGKKYTLKLDVESGYKYKILGYSTNIITVDYGKIYDVIIYNDKYYYETKIQLTNLPLIEITTESEITDSETNSLFKYINPSNLDVVVNNNIKIKIRGASSKYYDKKSYKIEFYNDDYNKEKSINISNFYYGSSFILDATYRDNSKIRNVLATELWNAFSDDFNNVDVYSEFVEVFINGTYSGVYVFTEPINRKKMNLNKSTLNDTSVILKTTDWEVPGSIKNKNILEDTYLGYELKYPNNEDLFSISWKKILSSISKYYSDTKISYKEDASIVFNNVYEDIENIFNINNYIDILLFNSFINNSDNKMIKNNYFYMKSLNEKIYIQPWDMEFSFGLRHSTDINYLFVKNMMDYSEIVLDIKHNNASKINKLLINRYWVLRDSILNEKYLDNLLNKYKNDLSNGAANRDAEVWLEYDINTEIEEIRTWLNKRIEVFDNYIKGLENE